MKKMLRFGALCAPLMLPCAAVAQENLPPIIIDAERPNQSLTVPTPAQAERQIQNTPGAVNVVPAEQYQNRHAATLKDMLDYVPGVIVQPKWGEDSRLSIRGSGLSRNFHLRSVQLYMDGIPVNTADGYGDFQEIDPSAYRYLEVYKGANALRYGANALGGAINFVTPSGKDADRFAASTHFGSFGFYRFQSSTSGVFGPADYFITGSHQSQDGFRQHSDGESTRANANLGYRFSENMETRFYINSNTIRQRIPGEVTRDLALNNPKAANADNILRDWQRNIDSLRIANKTTLRFDDTIVEFGLFGVDRHLKHPISIWIDQDTQDYGGFFRAVNESTIGNYRNRLTAGINLHNGAIDSKLYVNLAGAAKGGRIGHTIDRSANYSAYAENAFYFLPRVAFVTGAQYLFAVRDRTTLFGMAIAGRAEHDLFSPKIGLLWNIDPSWQVFANLSRSSEAPSFGEAGVIGDFTRIRAQHATTFELGTRGRRDKLTWDLAVYRGHYRDELQCVAVPGSLCTIDNIPRTMHQGIEAAVGVAILNAMFAPGPGSDKLWLNVAYTFSDFRFDRDPDFGNNELPGAPRQYLRTELLYKHPKGLSLGPNVEWVPNSYFVDNANTQRTASFALLGFRATYEASQNLTVFLDARNLTDEAYISAVSIAREFGVGPTNLFNPGTGRSIYGGIRMTY
jgi:iron complex outermembrane receptor protein